MRAFYQKLWERGFKGRLAAALKQRYQPEHSSLQEQGKAPMDDSNAQSESRQLPDTYPNAGRDSGYVAPVGENIVNVLTGLIAGMETKLLTGNLTLRAEIERQGEIRRTQFHELLTQSDTRHDAVVGELDKVLAVSEATALGLGKLSEQVGEMSDVLKHTIGRVSNVEETISDVKDVISEHAQQLATHEIAITEVRADVDQLKTGLRSIEAKIAALDTEQRLIRQMLAAHPQPEVLRNAKPN